MALFEKVSRFKDSPVVMPKRGTSEAAGYDMYAAEDAIIPPYSELYHNMQVSGGTYGTIHTLADMQQLTKATGSKPTLVSTGVKCKLDSRSYLKIVPRSSTPLKYWLVIPNSEGIIDADYYNCAQNEGEIFLQLVNLSPYPIKIQAGECVAQGIICRYGLTEDDQRGGLRVGGHGSTSE